MMSDDEEEQNNCSGQVPECDVIPPVGCQRSNEGETTRA